MTFWSDSDAAARLGGTGRTGQGRAAGSLRFSDTTADLRVRTFGNPARTGAELVGPRLRRLPADTAAALGMSGGDQLVRSVYDQLAKAGFTRSLTRAQDELGLRLPDDLAALVGSSTVIAVGGTADQLDLGLVTTTSDPDAARRAAERILTKTDAGAGVTARTGPDGTVLASSGEYADKLGAAGTLGEQEQFRAALPDLATAQVAVYVDVQRTDVLTGEELPDGARTLRSVGFTAASSGTETAMRLRVVVGDS